jgi:succinate dehydrogenase/fumarate reductase flavoprotein subunit
MEIERIQADVLCVGGGIGGLMAAMRASELGAKTVVAEKGNAMHSGKGGGGCDHYLCYIPEVHGPDMNAFIEEMLQTQQRHNFEGLGMKRIRVHIANTFDMVKMWDSWGIPMKYNGEYHYAGHAFPGGFRCLMKYGGQKQKPILTKKALEKGVEIVNRVMVFDLVSDGERVFGAVGMDTRDDKIVLFEAKSVILGTGGISRLYLSPTPGWFNNIPTRLSLTGDGRAMAYRAGAELQNVEMRIQHAGPKYYARFGQATWIGVFRDSQDKPIGPFVTKPERLYGDITPEVNKNIFLEYAQAGRGPVYIDGRGMTQEDLDYMMYWLPHEGNTPLIEHMKEEGIDYLKHPVEFMTYDHGSGGRIVTNEKAETSLPGLYAVGDELANGVSNASVFGWISGERATHYAKQADTADSNKIKETINEKKALAEKIRGRKNGPDWKEVNVALQQIMSDYAGPLRTEALLDAGLFHLRRLKQKALDTMMAANQHELGRSLEVLNMIDIGELVFVGSKERKETRGLFVRPDYPLTNPRLNNKVQVIKKVDKKPATQWRPMQK